MESWSYIRDERSPIEVLVFEMEPANVEEFLAVDHEVWTLGEALLPGFDRVPFVSKEVWLDGTRPGEVTLVFVWESADAWRRVADAEIQTRLQAEFDRRIAEKLATL